MIFLLEGNRQDDGSSNTFWPTGPWGYHMTKGQLVRDAKKGGGLVNHTSNIPRQFCSRSTKNYAQSFSFSSLAIDVCVGLNQTNGEEYIRSVEKSISDSNNAHSIRTIQHICFEHYRWQIGKYTYVLVKTQGNQTCNLATEI